MFQTRGFIFRKMVVCTGMVWFTYIRISSLIGRRVCSSFWRWTVSFKTCRRHQRIKILIKKKVHFFGLCGIIKIAMHGTKNIFKNPPMLLSQHSTGLQRQWIRDSLLFNLWPCANCCGCYSLNSWFCNSRLPPPFPVSSKVLCMNITTSPISIPAFLFWYMMESLVKYWRECSFGGGYCTF
jgi:hypothetical protein